MPRGRKRRRPNRDLPHFSKIPTFIYAALREGRIGRSAFCLWAVIRMVAWRDTANGRFSPPPVDLKDEELQAWLGGVTRRYVYTLIDELEEAGLLKVYHEGGRRWLQLLALPSPGNSRELYFTGKTLPNEDDDRSIAQGEMISPGNRPRHGRPLSQRGGEGGEQKRELEFPSNGVHGKSNSREPDFPSNGVHTGSALPEGAAAIAQVLQEHGVYPSPATDIARMMHEKGLTPDEALNIFLDVLADTEDIRLAVSRLRSGAWDTTAQERALEKARRRRYGAAALEGEPPEDRLQGPSPARSAAEPDPGVQTPIGEFGTAGQVWQAALKQLELELTKATFNTHLRRSRLVAYDNGVFTVAVLNEYSRGWLEHRLVPTILRVLRHLAGREDVSIRFVTEAEWAEESVAGVRA